MKQVLFYFFFALLSGYTCLSQSGPVELTGMVTNIKTKTAIAFASIRINRSSVGTICNEQGLFQLYLTSAPKTTDTVTISCMGYETATVVWKDFRMEPDIALRPAVFVLDEVSVFKEIPIKEIVSIMREALQRLHAGSPHQQWGIHKTTTRASGKYAGFRESYCAIYNQGYNPSFSDDKYKYLPTDIGKMIEARASEYALPYGEQGEPSKGVDLTALLSLKKGIVQGDLFSKKSFDYFDWALEDKTLLHGETVYLLSFKPKASYLKKKSKLPDVYPLLFKGIYSGRVYVQVQNGYVPIKIELSTVPYAANKKPFIHPRTNHISEPKGGSVTVQFERFGDKYYLSKIGYEKTYHELGWVTQPAPPEEIRVMGELIVTTLNTRFLSTNEITRAYGRIEQFHDIKLSEQTDKRFPAYRPEFWKNYPFIDQRLIEDLGGEKSLQNQFESNSNKSIVSPEEYAGIYKFYSSAVKARVQKP
jgi:hypothetical protein